MRLAEELTLKYFGPDAHKIPFGNVASVGEQCEDAIDHALEIAEWTARDQEANRMCKGIADCAQQIASRIQGLREYENKAPLKRDTKSGPLWFVMFKSEYGNWNHLGPFQTEPQACDEASRRAEKNAGREYLVTESIVSLRAEIPVMSVRHIRPEVKE